MKNICKNCKNKDMFEWRHWDNNDDYLFDKKNMVMCYVTKDFSGLCSTADHLVDKVPCDCVFILEHKVLNQDLK